ncbi:MAG: hypothetical protein V4506_16710 [Bacteroidota bacterium]
MKKIVQIFFSTLLLLTISWQCSAKSIIYFNFKYNQKKLAETVCENKDKAGSCCKAKCYLEKEIKKEEKRQSDLPSSIKDKTAKSELFSGYIVFDAIPTISIQRLSSHYVAGLATQYKGSLFHPPTGS